MAANDLWYAELWSRNDSFTYSLDHSSRFRMSSVSLYQQLGASSYSYRSQSQRLQRFFRRTVNRPAYITCFRTSGTPLSQTDYATQKHSSQCWRKLRNFAIHLYHTVSNIMISTAVANYALLANCCRRHWTLALGSFNILLFYCILY